MLRRLIKSELHALRGMTNIRFRDFQSNKDDDIGFKRLKKDQKGADEDAFFHKKESKYYSKNLIVFSPVI